MFGNNKQVNFNNKHQTERNNADEWKKYWNIFLKTVGCLLKAKLKFLQVCHMNSSNSVTVHYERLLKNKSLMLK